MHTKTSSTLLDGLTDAANRDIWQEFDGRYRPLILRVARRLGLDEEDAEDAAQETLTAFLKAYRNKKYERSKGRLRDWIQGIAFHKIRDIQRKLYKKETLHPDPDQGEDLQVKECWDIECKRAVLRQCLEEVRLEVAPKTFKAFELFALKQWPATKVAEHLNVSEDTVYQSKSRILARVKKLLPKMREIW